METQAEYTTQDNPDQYEDSSNDHSYFSMMPNILDDLLDPYQYRLYAHIKRVCGETGTCWQSTETIAKACKMSVGKVSECKRQLAKMGLVTITEKTRKSGRPYHLTRIVDIWARNMAHCSERYSPGEQASSQDEQASSPGEGKKTPVKKTPPKKKEGATAPPAPVAQDDSWPTEQENRNPAQQRLAKMRSKIGTDPLSVAAHCQQRQEAEGTWTVPIHRGLSPQCAVFKEATGYSPAKAVREDIDAAIPDNLEALENWYKVAHGWVLTGYSYRNVAGMLDWYAEGRVGRDKPEKRNGGSSTPRHNPRGGDNLSEETLAQLAAIK